MILGMIPQMLLLKRYDKDVPDNMYTDTYNWPISANYTAQTIFWSGPRENNESDFGADCTSGLRLAEMGAFSALKHTLVSSVV